MPNINIKNIGRPFSRRKSGGKELEEHSPTLEAPPGSGFRVIPRNDMVKKTVGGPAMMDPRPPISRHQSGDEWNSSNSNRGSHSTASSSAPNIFDPPVGTRFSSSSTLQSPVEAMKKESPNLAQSGSSTQFLNFSQDLDSDGFGDLFAGLTSSRRSQLIDDGIIAKPPAPAFVRSDSEPPMSHSSRPSISQRSTATPPPLPYLRQQNASPYSLQSRDSHDALMSSPHQAYSPTFDTPPPPPPKESGRRDVPSAKASLAVPSPQLLRTVSQESFTRSGASEDADAQMVRDSFKKSRDVFPPGPIKHLQRVKDDLLTPPDSGKGSMSSSSVNSYTAASILSSASSFNGLRSTNSSTPTTPGPSKSPISNGSNVPTPRAHQTPAIELEEEDEMPLFDASIVSAIRAVDQHGNPVKGKGKAVEEPRKVMTAKQYEILQKNSARASFLKDPAADNDSDGDYEDDEDDEAVQLQKRKAEQYKKAQHMLWRQKMVKDIGDQSSPLPGRPMFGRANQSTPNLMLSHSSKPSIVFSDASGSGLQTPDDDDDEVPLGVLQAHGFPRRENPPDPRLSAQSYTGLQRPLSAHGNPQRPSSPAMSVSGGPRGQALPPFARKLPQDPYMGQNSLATGASREALAFRGGAPAQPHFIPMGAPPNGLVGVIADEEGKRAMRRGSPNANMRQSTYGMPQMGMPMMAAPNGMPMMAGANGVDMQMQMSMMQHMQIMQQQNAQMMQYMQQAGMLPPSPMGMPGMPGMMPGMPSGGAPPQQGYLNPRPPQSRPMSLAQSRTMSMINPSLADLAGQSRNMAMFNRSSQSFGPPMSSSASVYGLGPPNNYAPSVAPSERSNIGQPSRYKPVAYPGIADGGSTITAASTLMPSDYNAGSGANPDRASRTKSFLSAIVRPPLSRGKGKENNFHGIEEEDEDWGSFASKRRGDN